MGGKKNSLQLEDFDPEEQIFEDLPEHYFTDENW